MNNIIFASAISEIQQSPMFMTVKAVICDTPEANLNGAKVTEAFVNEVVENAKRYVGLPLYADVKALTAGKYNRLGHLYDVKTGEFHSTQIGSFYKFETEEFDKGKHLIGYARIPKRNRKLSNAIAELFADGRLKFSFEVAVGEYEENDDGTITIDASENNFLEGTAIVTYPACEDAVALELVAQHQDAQEGDEQAMEKEKLTAEQAEEAIAESIEAEVAEAETAEASEPVQAENAEETAETEKAEEAKEVKAEEETAEVYVTETVKETHTVDAFDTETGKEVCQTVEVNTVKHERVEEDVQVAKEEVKETVEDSDNSGVAAEEGDDAEVASRETAQEYEAIDGGDEPVLEEETTDVAIPDSTERKIAELFDVIESLRQDIAELKESRVVAEAKTVTAETNPMMADINTQKKYSLLEKEERKSNSYSLLEKY